MRALYGLSLCTGIYVLALGVIIPIIPFKILELGGSPVAATLIYSVYSGASVLTLRFWGLMSDRFGRTPVLWLSVFITTLSYVWLAYADTLWEVYAARALAGGFAAWLPVSQALVSDIVPAHKRAPAMGLLGVGFGVGFTIGPALGGLLASSELGGFDFRTPFLLAAAFSALTLACTIFLVAEPKRASISPHQQQKPHSLMRDRKLILLLLLYFGISVMFTGIEGIFAVWSKTELNWQPKDVGYVLMLSGIGSIIAQGFLIRIANRTIGERRTILISIIGLSFMTSLLAMTQYPLYVIIALFGITIFIGLHNPAIQSMISQAAPEEWRGKVMGIAHSTASFARVIGPIWAGVIYQNYGDNSPFALASVFGATLLIFAYFVLRTPSAQDKPTAEN